MEVLMRLPPVSRSLPSIGRVLRSRTGLIAIAALAACALSGCVISPLPPPGGPVYGGGPVYADGPGPVVVAPMAPPPLIAEQVVVAPAPGYIWIGGFWSWNGGRHVWTGGRWVQPRPGYRWVPRQWQQGPGGWHQHGGHWSR